MKMRKRTASVLGALLLGGAAIGSVQAQGMMHGKDTMHGQGMMGQGMQGQGMMQGGGMMGGMPCPGMSDAQRAQRGQAMFGMMDADKDGAVSEDEFLAAHRQRFSTADADGDGRVTEEEMQQAMRAMHGQTPSGTTAAPSGATAEPEDGAEMEDGAEE